MENYLIISKELGRGEFPPDFRGDPFNDLKKLTFRKDSIK